MPDKPTARESCSDCSRFRVEALVSVDERGQMVLPKDVRTKAGIRGGDKLALTTLESDGRVCCILLTKSEELVQAVQSTLGSVAKNPTETHPRRRET